MLDDRLQLGPPVERRDQARRWRRAGRARGTRTRTAPNSAPRAERAPPRRHRRRRAPTARRSASAHSSANVVSSPGSETATSGPRSEVRPPNDSQSANDDPVPAGKLAAIYRRRRYPETGAGRFARAPPFASDCSAASTTRITSSPTCGTGTRDRVGPDRRAEVEQLEAERLGDLDARRDDVAGPVGQPVLAEAAGRRQVDPGVEDADGLAARVVVDDHLLRADDRRPPQLARREPRQLDVRDHAGAVLEVDERDVGRRRA